MGHSPISMCKVGQWVVLAGSYQLQTPSLALLCISRLERLDRFVLLTASDVT